MAIGVLANPEVRRVNSVTDPTYDGPAYEPQYDLSCSDMSPDIFDIPLFTTAVPLGPGYTYHSPHEPPPIPANTAVANTPSPTAPTRTALAHVSLDPATTEMLRTPSSSSSPPSSETTIDIQFRYSDKQWDYQVARATVRSEMLRAGFSEYGHSQTQHLGLA